MLLEDFISKKQKKDHKSFKRIGGGFYADVYKLEYENTEPLIVKVYKSEGIMKKEVSQLEILAEHAISPMPNVLWTHSADGNFSQDVLAMNCLKGENGGNVFYLSASKRARLAEQVVNNLLAFHNIHNPDGFGEIESDIRYKTFNEYYRQRAVEILKMAEKLHKKGQLEGYVLDVMQKAYESFDKVFYLPVTQASLVHGDYNMWNILVDRKSCSVAAVIDPCGCMWADSEYDLYQLNNANGRHLKLLEKYKEKKALSENCMQKMAFYELFTEIEHYYNSGYPVDGKKTKRRADALRRYL